MAEKKPKLIVLKPNIDQLEKTGRLQINIENYPESLYVASEWAIKNKGSGEFSKQFVIGLITNLLSSLKLKSIEELDAEIAAVESTPTMLGWEYRLLSLKDAKKRLEGIKFGIDEQEAPESN